MTSNPLSEIQEELDRLNGRRFSLGDWTGFGVYEFVSETSSDSDAVARRVCDVLLCVDALILKTDWGIANQIDSDIASKALPVWFNEAFEKMPQWDLDGWLYGFHPDERQWYWLKNEIVTPYEFRLYVGVNDYPFAYEALLFLTQASGGRPVLFAQPVLD